MVQKEVSPAFAASATDGGRKPHWLKRLMDCIARTHTHTLHLQCHPHGATFEPCPDALGISPPTADRAFLRATLKKSRDGRGLKKTRFRGEKLPRISPLLE
jgi:hypothetical protein